MDAAWDPRSDTWATLPPPPDAVTRAFWTGDEVIALGADATYRFGEAEWEALPEGPVAPTTLGGEVVAAAWSGEELLVVERAHEEVRVAGYDPGEGSWRTLPSHERFSGSKAVGVAWTGDELVVTDYDNDVVALDLASGRWRDLAAAPMIPQEDIPFVVASGGTIVLQRLPGIAVHANGGWAVLPADVLPGGRLEPGPGGTVLNFGLTDGYSSALGIVDPERAIDEPERIQIGFSVLTLDEDDSLRDMSSGGGPVASITATIATPEGDCTVTYQYVDVAPNQSALVACPLASTAERLRAQLSQTELSSGG